MHDVLFITQDARTTETFFRAPTEGLENLRIWVVVDNRSNVLNKIIPKNKDKLSPWRVRPEPDLNLIQGCIDRARDRNIAVFPKLIDGSAIFNHYNQLWKLNSDQIEFRRWHAMAVCLSAVSALHDFYGVEKVMFLDDDTFALQDMSDMFAHGYASGPSFHFGKINKSQEDHVLFGYLKDCLHNVYGSDIVEDLTIEGYDKSPACGGTYLLSDLSRYTEFLREIHTHGSFPKMVMDLQKGKRSGSSICRHIDMAINGLVTRAMGGHRYTSADVRVNLIANRKKGRAGFPKTIRSVPKLLHYVCAQYVKYWTAEWLTMIEKSQDSKGKLIYKTPDRFFDLPDEPLEETVKLSGGIERTYWMHKGRDEG